MTSIRFATFLGDNTVSIAETLTKHLSKEIDIPFVFDESAHRNSEAAMRAARSGHFDVIWACGRLLVELIDDGVLDADIVAAPIFEGEREPVYRSVVVARTDLGVETLDDCRDLRLAVNEPQSWSGNHGLVRHLHELGITIDDFGSVVTTGSHARSVEALMVGTADVAGIDHTIWHHLVEQGLTGAPGTANSVVVIGTTCDWPAPPFAIRRSLLGSIREDIITALLGVDDAIDGLAGVSASAVDKYDELRPN